MARKDRPLGLAPASVSDYREFARRRLPRQLFDYIDGGANSEITMRRNIADLAAVRLRQRVLRDVSDVNLATKVLGSELALPLILAPVGMAGMFARRAEVQAAQAAGSRGIAFCESTVSICGTEEVAAAATGPLWFQLYVMRDREYVADLMHRAAAVGCSALVLTVDLSVVGARYRDGRNGLVDKIPATKQLVRAWDLVGHPHWMSDVAIGGRPLTFGNLERAVPGAHTPNDFKHWVDANFDPSVTWDDLEWVRANWPGKLILKGILDPADAITAADRGADAVIVSNHGGRQLDSTPSTISMLPRVVEAVGDRIEVLVDGGIRGGIDVVKALALGARACLVGRPWAWAVASGGRAAVERMIDITAAEMRVAMSLTAVTDVAELDSSILL